jgi:hypothetical protein
MIVKEYYQNINCKQPKDYFERWYADVWARRIGKKNALPGELGYILEEELAQVGAYIEGKDRGYRFVVTFKDEHDYTMFVLRWS